MWGSIVIAVVHLLRWQGYSPLPRRKGGIDAAAPKDSLLSSRRLENFAVSVSPLRALRIYGDSPEFILLGQTYGR